MENKIEALKAYALANYEKGGEWVYETHDTKDYQKILDNFGGDVEAAKESIRRYWELTAKVAADIQNA